MNDCSSCYLRTRKKKKRLRTTATDYSDYSQTRMSKVQRYAKHFILTCQTTSILNISSYTHKLEGSECNSFLRFASFFIHSYEALQRWDHNTPRSKDVGPHFWNVSQCGLCSMDAMLNSYHSSQNICIVWPKEPKRNYVAECFANVATIKAHGLWKRGRWHSSGLQKQALCSVKSSRKRHTLLFIASSNKCVNW